MPAFARVFERHSTGLLSPDAYISLGWQQIYDAPMRIDGQDANVQMWQSDAFPEQALTALEEHCLRRNIPCSFFMGDRMGWGLSVAEGELIKHLIFSPDGNRNTFVLHIRSPKISTDTAGNDPWLMPGAEPTRSMINPQAGLHLLQSTSSASAQQVRQYYRGRFEGDGWTPHFDGVRRSDSDTDVYIKKGRMGILTANSTGQDGLTRITMMQQSKGETFP